MTKSIYDIRLENLRSLITTWGGPTSLSRKLGHANGSFVAQLAGPHPRRLVGEKVARQIESVLNLPMGWMDQAHAARVGDVQPDALTQCVQAVATVVQDSGARLEPAKFAAIVALIYEHHQQTGDLSEAYINRLVELTK